MSDKVKFEMEFPINSSPHMLYQYFSQASSLDEWFADNVHSRGEIYTFIWGDSEEKAKLQEAALKENAATQATASVPEPTPTQSEPEMT